MKQPDQREAEAAAADPWMTPERISLRNLAMSFTQKEIVPHLQDWEDAGELPRELHRRAAAAGGLLGIGFAEEIGGSGGDLRDLVLLTEAVMEAGGSSGLLASLLTHHIAVPHMAAQGDPEQIRSFVVPTLAGGEKIAASASPNPTPVLTSPASVLPHGATATITWSTVRSCSSPRVSAPIS